MAFASPRLDLATVLGVVKRSAPQASVVGVTTAGEITEQGYTCGGLSVMLLAGDEAEFLLEHCDSGGIWGNLGESTFIARRELARGRGLHASSTVLLTDGLSGGAQTLLRQLQNAGGSLHEIVGGAAGDESALRRTAVGSDRRILEAGGMALHLFTHEPWAIAVAEGFAPVTASLQVTRAEGNVIYELEGRPAFDAYQRYGETLGMTLSRETAGPFCINSQLAVLMFRQVKYARMVVGIEQSGALICNGEVPQGSSVSILGASRDTLLGAARLAASEARGRLGERKPAGVLMFASVARQATLRERYHLEVAAVREAFPEVPVAGFLTYGEIARYSARLEPWHNSSLVVAALPA